MLVSRGEKVTLETAYGQKRTPRHRVRALPGRGRGCRPAGGARLPRLAGQGRGSRRPGVLAQAERVPRADRHPVGHAAPPRWTSPITSWPPATGCGSIPGRCTSTVRTCAPSTGGSCCSRRPFLGTATAEAAGPNAVRGSRRGRWPAPSAPRCGAPWSCWTVEYGGVGRPAAGDSRRRACATCCPSSCCGWRTRAGCRRRVRAVARRSCASGGPSSGTSRTRTGSRITPPGSATACAP